jgi:antitoxin HicB
MHNFEYAVKLARADEGGLVVTCRDLPELITQGEDLQDALEQASDAMAEAFAMRIDDGLDFPIPSACKRGERVVAPPVEMMAKAILYITMRESGLNKTELARRLAVNEKEVRRMLDPHHGTRLPNLDRAMRALGKKLTLRVEETI